MKKDGQQTSMPPTAAKEPMKDETTDETKPMDEIVGTTIIDTRQMTEDEMLEECWLKDEIPMVLVLSNGTILYPSADIEGNDAGALFGKTSDGSVLRFY
jgi:hypothetical protein